MVCGQLPPVRVGFSVKVRVSFRVGRQPDNSLGEKWPPGQGYGLDYFWSWGQFSSGAIVLEPIFKRKSYSRRLSKTLTLCRMGLFGAAHKSKEGLFKAFLETYFATIKLGTVTPYLTEIQKVYKSCDTPFEFSNFCHIEKY